MNYYLRSLWHDMYRMASDHFETSVMVAAIAVLCVGLLCLRGNVIRH